MKKTRAPNRSGYGIFMPTLCHGTVPAWYDEAGFPVVYETEREAQREIAERQLILIDQFLAGERDFEDAMTVEDFILPVDVWPDGTISIQDGSFFGKQS